MSSTALTSSRTTGISKSRSRVCFLRHELDAKRFAAAPDDLAFAFRCMRYESDCKSTSDYCGIVDSNLRAVL